MYSSQLFEPVLKANYLRTLYHSHLTITAAELTYDKEINNKHILLSKEYGRAFSYMICF